MRGYIGVIDDEWYQLLAAQPEVSEVNFWRPGGGREFRALEVGEPLFFKRHAPHNQVVGGGFYSGFAALHASEAWQLLGQGNGAASLRQMRERIARYRREPIAPEDDPLIGCTFIRDVTFFPDDLSVDPPTDFTLSVVQGKSYDMGDPAVSGYFDMLMQLVLGAPLPPQINLGQSWQQTGPVFGEPRLAPFRLGLSAFKAIVLAAYRGQCAITRTKIRPVLQAAHIRPVSSGGENRLGNGLLLRADVHILFDTGYLSVSPEFKLLVSPRLREDFGGGEEFYANAGLEIALPDRVSDRPEPEFLEWHTDTVFKVS